jgi:hypothetical protein
MATVTTPAQSWNRDETQQRVRHPLQRLRSTIRTYVSAEGLAILALYVGLWFWIGLLLDYGFFRATGVDWVQELPWEFRAVVLGGLVAGLLAMVALKMLLRLWREFRDPALALVLERRFPNDLGDRLITAVELADPRLAQRYGFSQEMIDQTIRDAAERVDRLPVGEVFDWRRLRRYALRVAVYTFGLYVLVGIGYCAFGKGSVSDFTARFNNVAGIWFERNILLRNTIWPRQAQLELVDFPESGDLRVGRDAPPPALRVRALKWVFADRTAPEGWRAMRWSDITPDLGGEEYAPDLAPAEWQNWTVDQIEIHLDKPETLDAYANIMPALRGVLAHLEAQSESPRSARRFRRLEIPDVVTVYYKGETTRNEQTLKKQADNEYSGVLSDLRESVRFTANAKDYYTPYQKITLVPPPSLIELLHDEERPAYLYHRRPVDGKVEDLRGKKQIFQDVPVSLSGTLSSLDVPSGSNVVLKGKTDKPLQEKDGIRMRPRPGSAPITVPVQQTGVQSFEVRFDNVTAPLHFIFELTDTDNVVGLRPVQIKPMEDTPPEVDVMVEIIRKTNQGYMVTPIAHIPFSGKVRDDHGLSEVEYVYTVTPLEGQSPAAIGSIVSALQFAPRGLGADLLAPPYLSWVGSMTKSAAEETKRPPEKTSVATFARRVKEKEKAVEDVTVAELMKRLRKRPLAVPAKDRALTSEEFLDNAILRDHSFDPEEEFFDVEKLRLTSEDPRMIQPRFRMRLWVSATDNNIETGPGTSQSKEKFLILIVPENELLTEIAKEEETLHLKLEESVGRLKDARGKLEQDIIQELPGLQPNEFSPKAQRAEQILETRDKALDVSREVYLDYSRILKELKANRVRPQIIDKVENNICAQLDGTINLEFVQAEEALKAFHKTLEAKKVDLPAANLAKEKMDNLIDRLTRVLDAMGDITTINKLIAQLTEIEKGERNLHKRFKEANDKHQQELLDQALGGASKPEEKKDKNDKKP